MSKKTKCSNKHTFTPRCNHESCWNSYFRKTIGKVVMGKLVLEKYGREVFENVSGHKFTRQFVRFVGEMK